MLDDFLDLPSMRVQSIEKLDDQYKVIAECIVLPDACKKCGSTSLGKFGRKPQTFIDLPSRLKYVTIHVERRRFRCNVCGITMLQPMPDMALKDMEEGEIRSGGAEGHLMTRRLVDEVAKSGFRRTFTDIARDTGIDDRTVRRIVSDRIDVLERTVKFETPEWLGLDEIHIIEKVCGVVTNVERRCLIDFLPKRDQASIIKYLTNLPDKDLVKIVAIDMWRPYFDAIGDVLPKALVVIDKFHIVRMAKRAWMAGQGSP